MVKRQIYLMFLMLLLVACREEEIGQQQVEKHALLHDIGCRVVEMNVKTARQSPLGYQGRGSLMMGNQTMEWTSTKTDGQQKYLIPVVFHVFGNSFNGLNVTEELIREALQKTNEDFQGLTADWQQVTPPFDLLRKVLNIEFRLVQKDPEGNPTSGVIFYPHNSGFGDADKKNAEISACAWDNYKYMNVYIMEDLYGDGATNNSGIAWYPDEYMSDRGLARVVYNGAYVGNNTNENFRSVLTHEFGHWLNLIHTFEGGCSYPNDEVEDTPPHEGYFLKENDLNCEGNKTNWQNFMTYTNNYANFTIGQVERMLKALAHPARYPLWQEDNLQKVFYMGDQTIVEVIDRTLFEDQTNDGTFSGCFRLSLMFGKLKGNVGEILPNSAYQVQNLPQGLSVSIRIAGTSSLEVFIDGQTSEHTSANNTFFQLTLTGDICDKPLYVQQQQMELRYRNPYRISHTPFEGNAVCSGNTSLVFQISPVYPSSVYALSYEQESGKLRIDARGKALISETFSRNVSCLSAGEEIAATSSWIQGNDQFLHDLHTASYQKWAGKTAYAGIFFPGASDSERLYGWLKFRVSEAGDSLRLLGYAFHEEPDMPLRAGQTDTEQWVIDALITADKRQVKPGETIRFSFAGWTEEITSFRWSFQNATPAISSEEQPEVIYRESGQFDVTLELTDSRGREMTIRNEKMIRVSGENIMDSPQISTLIIATGKGNTFFQVKNMETYTENELTIWNPVGKEILKQKNYRNDFDMKKCPAGTYYYCFSWKSDGKKEKITGYTELIR